MEFQTAKIEFNTIKAKMLKAERKITTLKEWIIDLGDEKRALNRELEVLKQRSQMSISKT